MKIKSVDLVPAPGGYFLDIVPEGEPLQRFKFHSVAQITAFSTDARRIALMAAGLEEHNLLASEVQEGDLVPSIGGGRVDSIDIEQKYKDIVSESELDETITRVHFSFQGTEAILSVPSEDGVSVVRKIK
jgi:hypothetical protein